MMKTNVVERNFFRLLRSGALHEYEAAEPMSHFKWEKLYDVASRQHMLPIIGRGLKNSQFDRNLNLPPGFIDRLAKEVLEQQVEHDRLSNVFLNRRLTHIREQEPHEIDASMTTLSLLDLLVSNTVSLLREDGWLAGLIRLGVFLRTRGDRVDFVKLESWIGRLHLAGMAEMQGNLLIALFKFEADEVPFVKMVNDRSARQLLREMAHDVPDASNWHFRQSRSGFVHNNHIALRRSLRRASANFRYAPLEVVSSLMGGFLRSLREIPE